MKYSKLPEKFKFLEMVQDDYEHPNGYAWICIGGFHEDVIYPYIQAWIYAEDEVIQCTYDQEWFKKEIENLLEDKFIPNPVLEYLVEFIWDNGEKEVEIFPGYSCNLVLDDDKNPVIRQYTE